LQCVENEMRATWAGIMEELEDQSAMLTEVKEKLAAQDDSPEVHAKRDAGDKVTLSDTVCLQGTGTSNFTQQSSPCSEDSRLLELNVQNIVELLDELGTPCASPVDERKEQSESLCSLPTVYCGTPASVRSFVRPDVSSSEDNSPNRSFKGCVTSMRGGKAGSADTDSHPSRVVKPGLELAKNILATRKGELHFLNSRGTIPNPNKCAYNPVDGERFRSSARTTRCRAVAERLSAFASLSAWDS